MSVLLLSHASGQQPAADQILNRSRELSIISSMQATISLSIVEKNGASRSRTIAMTSRSYPGGLEKRFIKFLEPADVRGTAMLIIDNKDVSDEIWIYLPALKKTRRISSSENARSFMSSEFSNADMGSPNLADFRNRHIDGSGTNNTWIIESIPVDEDKADEYGYSRKISYISMDKFRVSRMEFYNFDNKHFKTIEITEFHEMPEGKYMVSKMTAVNQINGRKSEIFFRNISDNIKVEDSYFSVQNLER
ncbi:MAG: outer membrane lipoprotein-sorting protein [Bacteroidales bacterium]|nr:outer membrane lipoprotein-sorting protein [Bacteroidales bacterium]